ncbi:MAG: cation:proton antiporter [Polyangiaceae bacterium]|nr:cation:proton antiporter [Polyangiaceae bacterium]
MSVASFILAIAGIFLIGAAGEAVFKRTHIPDVIWLIVVGIVLGPVLGFVSRESLTGVAPYFAAVTLVVVLFEGGSKLDLADVSRAAPRSALLALATFLLAVCVVALVSMGARVVGWLSADWSWSHGLLLGAILGGSSSIIIMPAMQQAKIDARIASLVGLESAFTDAFCVVGASALIGVLAANAVPGQSPATALLVSFAIGGGMGCVSGAAWLLVLRFLQGSDHAYPITLSSLLVLYVAIDHAGGSAALGILAFAVIVGNAKSISARVGLADQHGLGQDVRGFHAQMAFIIKSFFFTFIGAMLGPPVGLIVLGVLLGLLLLVARIPGVLAATLGTNFVAAEKKLIAVSLPRGMAAGVLATLPAAAGVPGTEALPTVVFAAVFTTIVVFAVGFPLARRGARAPPAPAASPEATPPIGADAAAGADVPVVGAPAAGSPAAGSPAAGSPDGALPTDASPTDASPEAARPSLPRDDSK